MYHATSQIFISLIQRKENNQEISLNQRNFSLGIVKNILKGINLKRFSKMHHFFNSQVF